MLTVVHRNLVTSTEGYGVRQTGSLNPTFLYFEGDHTLEFHGERSTDDRGAYSTVIFADSIRAWRSPHETTAISTKDRATIFHRVKEVLSVLGHNPTFFPREGI